MRHRFVIKNIKTSDIICKALDCYLRDYSSIGEYTENDIYSIYLKIKSLRTNLTNPTKERGKQCD